MYVRKSERACNAVNSPRYAKAVRIANERLLGAEFEIVGNGDFEHRVRIWGNPYEDYVTDDDVRSWLLNTRVVELHEGLEFVREGYIKSMIRDGFLRKDEVGSFYWVTQKAAKRWKLPKVLGCDFAYARESSQ